MQTSPEDPARQPFDVHRPFTRAEAVAAGIDPRALRSSAYRQILKGVYVSARRPASALLQAEAALVVHPPGAFASHFTAARVLELPVPTDGLEHVSVFVEKDRRRRKELACHVAAPGARIGLFRGIPISMPTQLFAELASALSLLDLVILGDAMVRQGRVGPEEIVSACQESTDKHAGAARRAAQYVRRGVDSPMETRLRLLLVLGGLPEPEVNHTLYDDHGNLLRRFDLSYPELRLVVEYDGRQHAEDPQQYDSDIYRREELDGLGWRLLIVTSKGIYQSPEVTLSRVRNALVERGASGLPRRLSEAWRPHFPVHRPLVRSRPHGRQ